MCRHGPKNFFVNYGNLMVPLSTNLSFHLLPFCSIIFCLDTSDTDYIITANFLLKSVQPQYEMVHKVLPSSSNDEIEIRANFQNLFNSIAKNDAKKSESYHEMLKQEAVKGRQAFVAMKEDLHTVQNRNAYRKRNFYTREDPDESVVATKRETSENERDTPKEVKLELRKYYPHEIEELRVKGLLKDYFNCAMRTLEEEMRVNKILGFICASALIRDTNKNEFEIAQKESPGKDCETTWIAYIRTSNRTPAVNLRGTDEAKPLLNQFSHKTLARAQCRSFPICTKHIRDDPSTVQVLSQLRNGTSKTIIDMLKKEHAKFLLTVDEMNVINIFVNASGSILFPFHVFEKDGRQFAVPQLRGPDDKIVCATKFCK